MPLGTGVSPAGAAAAGYGVPDAASVPNNAILPAAITGFPQTGRYLNPQTGDYQFTSDGRLMGMDTVPQLVTIALKTIRGSSAIPTLGQTFSQIQEKGPSFLAQMTAACNMALADLVKRNMVQIKRVFTQEYPSNPDAGVVWLKWTDLTTDLEHSNTVGQ